MQEVCKLNFKINVIPNVLEKCMIFNVYNKLFSYSFQYLGSSLDSLIKNLNKETSKKDFILMNI